ncbi:MAG: PTS sugar transporter subunit IIA, partial [Treponema sp.]|nr:PTS sugar transporter subunit IIA [Treponema sp.]
SRGGCGINRAEALDALIAREEKMTTGIIPSVAIPHASCPSVKTGFGAIGISRGGIEYGSLDAKPVHVVFMLLFGSDGTALHLKVMQQLALILKDPQAASRLVEKKTPQEVYDELCALEEALA